MYKSGSTRLIRNLNKHHTLNLVRLSSGITAREISSQTGLQMSTVLDTLKSLADDGFIQSLGVGSTTALGGKPPVIWGIKPDYGNVIGIELLSTEARLVVLNFSRECIYKNIFPISKTKKPEELVNQIKEIIRVTISKLSHTKTQILGIGIGFPGSIDHINGVVRFSDPFEFHNIPLRHLLESKMSYKFEIDNDANAGAIGVKWMQRKFQDKKHILYASIHQNFSGMGIGYVLNDQLFRGAHGAAGEIKSFITEEVWQKLLKTITKKEPDNPLVAALNKSKSTQNLKVVLQHTKDGNLVGNFILREIAIEISRHIAQLVNLFDPEVVIIGGDICEAEMFIAPVLKEKINSFLVSDITRNVPVHFSEFGNFSGAIGATALFYSKIFDTE